jgi:hypothetical protein
MDPLEAPVHHRHEQRGLGREQPEQVRLRDLGRRSADIAALLVAIRGVTITPTEDAA